jgi:hypothetical protein
MHAQPEPLWSTRGKHAPSPCIPVPCCHGVPCMFLTVLLSYAAVAIALGGLGIDTSRPCTPQGHPGHVVTGGHCLWRARASHAATNLCHLRDWVLENNGTVMEGFP